MSIAEAFVDLKLADPQNLKADTTKALTEAGTTGGAKGGTAAGASFRSGMTPGTGKTADDLVQSLARAGTTGGAKGGTAAGTSFQSKIRAPIARAVDELARALETGGGTGGQKGGLAAGRSFIKELARQHPEITPTINSAKALIEAKALRTAITRELSGAAAGGAGGAAGAGGGIASIFSGGAVEALSNPYVAAGAVALGAVVAPIIAQAIGGGIIAGLGGALSGMAIYGALKAKPVQKVFTDLKTSVGKDLMQIGKPFQTVLESIFTTAGKTFKILTPVFTLASKIISGPFKAFVDTFLKAFTQPAVKSSITAVAGAFARILAAVTPSLPGDVAAIAGGITNIAAAIAKNPQIFADFVQWIADIVKWSLDAIAALTRVATWIEKQVVAQARLFGRMVGDVQTAWHDIVHWFTVGVAGVVKAFDVVRRLLVTDEKGWIDTAVSWFRQLPGRIVSAVGSLSRLLWQKGKDVISGLFGGLKDVWGTVTHWISGLPHAILHFLGFGSPPKWAIQAGRDIMHSLGVGMSQAQGKLNSIVGGIAGAVGGALSAPAGSVKALMQSMAAARGWTGAQWASLNNVEMREAGYSLTATNKASGAYGLAQFINGPSEYMLYGGNASTAAGQITGMLNYIAQRYGNPAAAWQHELGFGWYDRGGMLPPGLSLAMNATGRPERVLAPGVTGFERDLGQSGGIETRLEALIAAVYESSAVNADQTARGLAAVLGVSARLAAHQGSYSAR